MTPICKLCDRFWDAVWEHSYSWERAASNEDHLFSEESDETWSLIQRAAELEETDSSSAFQLYLAAAEAGSAWSLEKVGWYYWTGTVVPADLPLALNYFRRAIGEGSWMATIAYARLVAELGHHEDCERTLEDGVSSGFVPAYFWLAWFRYQRSKTNEVRRKLRPLLEHAAEKGHPRAKLLLAGWMVSGKFGLGEMWRGWRLAYQATAKVAF